MAWRTTSTLDRSTRMFEPAAPHPPGRRRPKNASVGPYRPNGAFLGKLNKTKVEEGPRFSRDGSGQFEF